MEKIKEVIKRLEPLVMSGELTGEALQQRLLDECKLITPSDNRKIVVYKDGSYKLFSKIDPTFEYEGDIDWLVTIEVPAPSPSQVLTAEEVLKRRFKGLESRIAYPNVYQEKVIFAAMQEYSTLQTQQLQNRVKELEEANKEARNEALQEAQDALTRRGFINTDAHHNGKIVHYELEKLKK